MSTSPLLLAVGAPTWDTIFKVPAVPPPPAKILAEACVEMSGGTASNGACAVARLGGRVEYWGRVGDDPTGARIVADLAAEGIDVAMVRRIPGGRSTVSSILVDARGERLIVPFYDPHLDPDPSWLPLTRLGRFATALVDTRWPAGAAAVLKAARVKHVPTLLDADTTPQDIMAELVPLASHVVFAEPALTAFTGLSDPDAALHDAGRRLVGFVGVTLGARGFRWLESGAVRSLPAPRVDVVDTLGAGDTFHGALALGLAEGMTVDAAGRFACAAAALKCTRFGGRAATPTRAEVESFLGRATAR
jgi:sulfofructose kinase